MTVADEHAGSYIAVPASHYNFDALAEIYNEARTDYIVPMPMNGKRMAEYVRDYDIYLENSVVGLNSAGMPAGISMLGIRDRRSWITRLGVIPEQRGHKIGMFLVEHMLEQSRQMGVERVQLEVINGNEPAIRLFHKIGFRPVRDLLVVRRAPGLPPETLAPECQVGELSAEDILTCLQQRDAAGQTYAWTEETISLLNSGGIKGLWAQLPDGEVGWIIFKWTPFQLTHIVIAPNASATMVQALLYHLHARNYQIDTKTENLPTLDPNWPIYQMLGYFEVFSRVEMYLYL